LAFMGDSIPAIPDYIGRAGQSQFQVPVWVSRGP
jgi:hypothetical protein